MGQGCCSSSCCHGPAKLLHKQQPPAKLQAKQGRGHSQGLLACLGSLFWEETAEETYCSLLLQQLIKERTSGICCILRTDFIARDGFS